MTKVQLKLIDNSSLKGAFEKIIQCEQEQGNEFDPSHVHIRMKNEERAWPSRAANFLKHADKVPDDYLNVDSLRNETVLIGACTAYLQIMPMPSPEVIAFCAFWAAKNDTDVGDGAEEILLKLKSVEESARYELCANFIRDTDKK